MPRNTTGGNKSKKGKNYNTNSRELTISDNESTFYGLVQKPLGGGHFAVHCNDSEDRIATLRGSLQRNTRIAAGDVVLISLREFETPKPGKKQNCDIILKYNSNEVSQLKKQGVHYKTTGAVFSLNLDGEGFGKDNKADGVQFDNDNSYGNINIISSDKKEQEQEENQEQPEDPELDVFGEREENDKSNSFGPRPLVKQHLKEIADMIGLEYEGSDEEGEVKKDID